MKSRRKAKLLLAFLQKQREDLPQISKLGTDNWSELDEQINVLNYYLETGSVPLMHTYYENMTYTVALWLFDKYPLYDEFLEQQNGDN